MLNREVRMREPKNINKLKLFGMKEWTHRLAIKPVHRGTAMLE